MNDVEQIQFLAWLADARLSLGRCYGVLVASQTPDQGLMRVLSQVEAQALELHRISRAVLCGRVVPTGLV